MFHDGPLGIFITETTDGQVVINGPKENGHQLRPDGVAAQKGLRKGDQLVLVNGQFIAGMSAAQVLAMVGSAQRPLELVLRRPAHEGFKGLSSGAPPLPPAASTEHVVSSNPFDDLIQGDLEGNQSDLQSLSVSEARDPNNNHDLPVPPSQEAPVVPLRVLSKAPV